MRTKQSTTEGPDFLKRTLDLLISQDPAPLSTATVSTVLGITSKRASQVLRLICDKGYAKRVGWGQYQLLDLDKAKDWRDSGLLWGQFKGTPIGKRQSHPID